LAALLITMWLAGTTLEPHSLFADRPGAVAVG
jgi:hypothetical protein